MDLTVHKRASLLSDLRRLNVAVTRARNGSMVVGCEEVTDSLSGRGRHSKDFIHALKLYRTYVVTMRHNYPRYKYLIPSDAKANLALIPASQTSILRATAQELRNDFEGTEEASTEE